MSHFEGELLVRIEVPDDSDLDDQDIADEFEAWSMDLRAGDAPFRIVSTSITEYPVEVGST